jgi:hypothetical protein
MTGLRAGVRDTTGRICRRAALRSHMKRHDFAGNRHTGAGVDERGDRAIVYFRSDGAFTAVARNYTAILRYRSDNAQS